MSRKSQAEKVAAMVSKAQAVERPSNLPARDHASRQNSKPEHVNVGVKVRKDIAYWWTAQGKLKRRAVADVIREALIAEYGLPDDVTEADVYPESRKDG